MKKLEIQSITELSSMPNAEELGTERIENAIRDLLRRRNDISFGQNRNISFMSNLVRKKIEIWRLSSREIAVPIMNIFGDTSLSGERRVVTPG